MNKIDIVLSLASPLYVAYPDNVDKKNNVSRTVKQPMMANGRVVMVPYYPANGFRGGLRRKAARFLMNHFVANEGPVSGDLFLGLSCGASSGSPDQTPLSVEEILRARQNVYMGLFGGGARLHQSMYRVSDMLPIIADTVQVGAVPSYCGSQIMAKPAKDGQSGVEYLKPWELTGSRTSIRVDDLYRVMDPTGILGQVKDPATTVSAHQSAVMANRKGRKEGDEGKSDVAFMMGIETIAAGVPFHFSIDLDSAVTEAMMGMMLLALESLFHENAFGGWTRCGFGKVRVEHMSVSFDGDDMKWGNLYGEDGRFALPREAMQFVEAAKEAIATLKISDVASFFEDFSAEAKAKKKSEAKAKKAAKEQA